MCSAAAVAKAGDVTDKDLVRRRRCARSGIEWGARVIHFPLVVCSASEGAETSSSYSVRRTVLRRRRRCFRRCMVPWQRGFLRHLSVGEAPIGTASSDLRVAGAWVGEQDLLDLCSERVLVGHLIPNKVDQELVGTLHSSLWN